MYYNYEVVIETTNDADDPVVAVAKLGAGHIKHISVNFPPGPNRHAHIVIWDDARQLLPLNQDGDLAYDDYTVEADMWEPIIQGRNTFYIIGWNTDASWPHTIKVGIDVEGVDEPNLYRLVEAYSRLLETVVNTIRSIF